MTTLLSPDPTAQPADRRPDSRKVLHVMNRAFWLVVQTVLWLVVALAGANYVGVDVSAGVVVIAFGIAVVVAWFGTSAIGRGADQG
jgi:hypothetical protein